MRLNRLRTRPRRLPQGRRRLSTKSSQSLARWQHHQPTQGQQSRLPLPSPITAISSPIAAIATATMASICAWGSALDTAKSTQRGV